MIIVYVSQRGRCYAVTSEVLDCQGLELWISPFVDGTKQE